MKNQTAAASKKRPGLAGNLLVLLLTLVLLGLGLELAIRALKGEITRTDHIITYKVNTLRSAFPAQYDPLLGWVPKPNETAGRGLWLTRKVSILENGLRSNGHAGRPPDGKVILAVGDSFTFGDEVSDHQTWPALLEERTGARVLNGGVFGYGLDQSILRAKALIPRHRPDILIVSFIPHDILRCEASTARSVAKPYYEVQNDRLVLRNVPTPVIENPDYEFDWFRRWFGYSYLAHSIMIRLAPQYWLYGSHEKFIWAHHQGKKIAKLLLEDLAAFSAETGLKTLVVIQENSLTTPEQTEAMARLLEETDTGTLRILNVVGEINDLKAHAPEVFERYFLKTHMSEEGNRWLAKKIEALLKSDPYFEWAAG